MAPSRGRSARKTGLHPPDPVSGPNDSVALSLPPQTDVLRYGPSYWVRRINYLLAWVCRELRVYRMMSRDSRTPRRSKILLWIAVGYAVWPLGLLPDFIPVIGYLDDLIIVPTLIFLAVRGMPREVVWECRQRAGQ